MRTKHPGCILGVTVPEYLAGATVGLRTTRFVPNKRSSTVGMDHPVVGSITIAAFNQRLHVLAIALPA
jgi:hypothetical protein